jgi:hypothetical protein
MISAHSAELLLMTAGALHYLQIPSMAYLRRGALKLESDLRRLTPVNARIVRVFVFAVMLLLLGLGALAMTQPQAWLESSLGTFLSLLLGGFWIARAAAQIWLFRVWPAGSGNRSLYFGLLLLYAYLAFSYLAVGFSALEAAGSAPSAQRTPVLT